jgi:YfiH family protein
VKEVLTSALLSKFSWLEHGFGTRLDVIDQDAMASLDQIHSARILRTARVGRAGSADALVTNTLDLAISIRTADCLPILLTDSRNRAVAAVHAGWRGSAEQIVRRTIDEMRSEFDTSPKEIVAAIGPGIGKCCYEVGEEVAREFGLGSAGKIDLAAINREQLMNSGVSASQIDTLDACTMCDAERWWSYRRDREAAGRMISWIRIRTPE